MLIADCFRTFRNRQSAISNRKSADGRSILFSSGDVAAEVSRVDLTSGARSPWKTLIPSDRAGIMNIPRICISPDARSYAYSYNRVLSELYVVDGVK